MGEGGSGVGFGPHQGESRVPAQPETAVSERPHSREWRGNQETAGTHVVGQGGRQGGS